jgi:hypothetical protein
MTSMKRTILWGAACLAAAASLVSACTGAPGGASIAATPTPEICGDIPADIGGCSSNRPVYQGTTCEAVGQEWGRWIERLVTPIFDDAGVVDGEQKSVRVHEALVLATITAGLHLDEVDLLGVCTSTDFVALADRGFSQGFRDGLGSVLYDDAPTATWDQFLFELQRAIKVIDVSAAPPS